MSELNAEETYEVYVGQNGKFYSLLSSHNDSKISACFNKPSVFLVLKSYLREMRTPSYHGFLTRNRRMIVSSSDFTAYWKDLDETWSRRFLIKATEDLDEINAKSLLDKVRFFILQREVTPLRGTALLGELLGFNCW